ncbi:MAG: KTSC domain-containing protein [Nitrospirae bacterium]|nr:MAG: KTSC domain-containing protein [Nitrospirota bacterium]
MNRMPVSSSNIASIGYDERNLTLEIEFHDGSIYQYFDVPETVYQEFMGADSKGRYLHQHIKNNYRYTRL